MLPFMQNPQSVAIRKYLFDVLKERYGRNSKYIERLAANTLTKEDYESIGKLIADVYEAGFMRAMDQYKEQMSRLGMRVNVVPEKAAPGGSSIFGDQPEKSG